MEIFAKRLRALRVEAGEKQTDLQEALHCSQGMVSAYENGREPSFDTLAQIAQHYHTTTDFLLGLTATRQADTGALASVIDEASAACEQGSAAAIAPDDLTAFFAQITRYMSGPMAAGTLPMETARQLVTGMTALLAALTDGSTGALIDANDQLISTILSVSQITTAHLAREERP